MVKAQDTTTAFPQNNSFPELAPPPTLGSGSGSGGYTTFDEDDDPGHGGGGNNNVPIDGGLSILLAVGIALGIKSYRIKKNHSPINGILVMQ